MPTEAQYQRHVVERLEVTFPGCMVLKNDANLRQGIPDLIVLYENTWAMLEVKVSHSAPKQANQEYYINLLNSWSYAAFIYPENEDVVFDALQRAL